ncbi:hypothetical protein BKA70DRAFT_1567963 [Coprinopsis sp. MPI-PUGE-AT-0042]|nr:hypothetical protein BKA70DRAFT_1567963 [Coprinopsis sp. MPI-PUGE-AT-0042]
MSHSSPLIPYVESNNPLPEELAPSLEEHLSLLRQSIGVFDDRIAELERALELARNERAPLEEERLAYAATKSALRRFPPELIGMIFSNVLGGQAFGPNEYLSFAHLGGVCKSWRNVIKTAPNLCHGLRIQLDDWPFDIAHDAREVFRTEIVPWLEVAGKGGAFELVLGVGREDEGSGALTITWANILRILFNFNRPYPQLTRLALHKAIEHGSEADEMSAAFATFEGTFPSLDSLYIGCSLRLDLPLVHSSLRSLQLEDLVGSSTPIQLKNYLEGLPQLEELVLPEAYPASFSRPSSRTSLQGPNYSLKTWKYSRIWTRRGEHFPNDLDESLARKVVVESTALTEIVCDINSGDLRWLAGGIRRTPLIKLYVPSPAIKDCEIDSPETQLREWGFELLVRPVEEIEDILLYDKFTMHPYISDE